MDTRQKQSPQGILRLQGWSQGKGRKFGVWSHPAHPSIDIRQQLVGLSPKNSPVTRWNACVGEGVVPESGLIAKWKGERSGRNWQFIKILPH